MATVYVTYLMRLIEMHKDTSKQIEAENKKAIIAAHSAGNNIDEPTHTTTSRGGHSHTRNT